MILYFLNWKEPKNAPFFRRDGFLGLLGFDFALHESLEAYLNPFAPLPLVPVVLSFLALTSVLLHSTFYMHWNRVYLDPLTGIPNRQALEDRLHTLTGRFTLAMMDIDHFKHFNDTYGHEEGDNMPRMVAQHFYRQEAFGRSKGFSLRRQRGILARSLTAWKGPRLSNWPMPCGKNWPGENLSFVKS